MTYDRKNLALHELAVPRVQHSAWMPRERLQLKIEKLPDVQCPGLVLLVKILIARLVDFTIEHTLLNQELRPFEIAVAGEKRIVEVEERELHPRGVKHHIAFISSAHVSSESLRSSRRSGTVTARRACSE